MIWYFQESLQGSQPSVAKASTQDQPMEELRFEKPKSKSQELKALTLQHSDNAKTSEKARKKKKKNDWKHEQSRQPNDMFSRAIAATGDNTINNFAGGSWT